MSAPRIIWVIWSLLWILIWFALLLNGSHALAVCDSINSIGMQLCTAAAGDRAQIYGSMLMMAVSAVSALAGWKATRDTWDKARRLYGEHSPAGQARRYLGQ